MTSERDRTVTDALPPPRGPSRTSPWRVAGLVLMLAAAAVWYLQGQRVRLVPAEEAPPAGDLVLRDLAGATIHLAALRGQVVVLNAWAGWCGPCRSEVPGFSRVYEAYSARGLEILGLNVEGLGSADLAALRQELDIRYPIVVADGALAGSFEVPERIPHSWFIDRHGRIRASHSGYIGESVLRRAVERLLAE